MQQLGRKTSLWRCSVKGAAIECDFASWRLTQVEPGRPGGLSPPAAKLPSRCEGSCLQRRKKAFRWESLKEKEREAKKKTECESHLVVESSLPDPPGITSRSQDQQGRQQHCRAWHGPHSQLSQCLAPLLPSRYSPPFLRLRKKISSGKSVPPAPQLLRC